MAAVPQQFVEAYIPILQIVKTLRSFIPLLYNFNY
jgi:hypothetical protein